MSIPAIIATEAEKRRTSRSGLSDAVPDDAPPHSSQAEITRRLDAVYAEEAEPLDPVLVAAQAGVLPPERWR